MDFKEFDDRFDSNKLDADTEEKFTKTFGELEAQFEKSEKDVVLKVAMKAFLLGLKMGYEYDKVDWLDIFTCRD